MAMLVYGIVVLLIVTSYSPRSLAVAPEKRWLEDDPFLLGRYLFRGELLNFRSVSYTCGQGSWSNLDVRNLTQPKDHEIKV